MEETQNTIKILLVGQPESGKTLFLNILRGIINSDEKTLMTNLIKDNCSRKFYNATVGVQKTPVEILNSSEIEKENILVEFWDCAGQEKFKGLFEGYYIGADIAFVFCRNHFFNDNCFVISNGVERVCDNIPIIKFCSRGQKKSILHKAHKKIAFFPLSQKELNNLVWDKIKNLKKIE